MPTPTSARLAAAALTAATVSGDTAMIPLSVWTATRS